MMKKRLVSMLVLAALVLSMIVVPASAAGENITLVSELCPCGCGKTLENVSWQPWKGDPKEGHYYLDGNYIQVSLATVLSDTSVVLDLRGCTITTEEVSQLFAVNGYLHVLDTVGGGRMMAKTPKGVNGGVVQVIENESIGPMFVLHSGTITPDATSQKAGCGGLVGVGNGATFRMTGGMLLNGHAESAYGGGAVGSKDISSATIEILGGSIVGCSASKNGGSIYTNGTLKLENCQIIGGTAGNWGGNIFISGTNASLTVKNCTISNGISNGTVTGTANKYGGGNIIIYSGASASISDSVICGGYAACSGGNLCLGRGTASVTNTAIYGGSCGELGENVYGALSSAKATFNGCTIDGGFHQGSSPITLKGTTKIGGTGMRLGGGTLTTTGLTSGAEIYVTGNKTFTGTESYFKPATRAAITADGTALTVALAADGAAGYCPLCNAQVAWNAYGTEGATHTYLTADMTDFTELSVTDDLVIDLAGFDIIAPGRAFTVAADAVLTVIDSVGQGVVTGSGVNGENGGVIVNNGTLKLYGGKYVYANNADISVTGGGIIYNAGSVTVSGSYLDGSAFSNYGTADNKGGVIGMTDGETVNLTMNGCYVIGGKAYYGGGLCCGYKNIVNINACQFTGGAAVSGGNIATYASSTAVKGTLNMTGCRITDGQADSWDMLNDKEKTLENYGGNMYIGRYQAQITDCYLADGEAELYGGNLNVSNTTDVVLTDCILDGGQASYGGNCYGPGNSVKVTFTDCLITNGKASIGGNLSLNNGMATVEGGEISYGSATSNGGNINAGSDDDTGLILKADTEGNAPLICHGTAANNGGNLRIQNIATITAAFIHSGTATNMGADLYVEGTGLNLTLGTGVTGDIHMNASSSLLADGVYGGAISNVTCEATDAHFYMDGKYGDCIIVTRDKTLYVTVASVVAADGSAVGYITNAEAVASCDENSYVKLFTANDLELTKDLFVDLNGKAVTVTGDYAFYGMDSSGDGYSNPTGSVTGTSVAEVQSLDRVVAPNGNIYIAVVADGVVTYHRLGMQITGVSVRPHATPAEGSEVDVNTNGMYYTAKWSCDETLKEMVSSYGIAVSVKDMPGADFATEGENRWTAMGKDSFASGVTQNSVLVQGILRTHTDNGDVRGAAQNDQDAKTPIYAKAYITFTDGPTYVSDDNVDYSLYDMMKNLDRLVMEKPLQYRKYNLTLRAFYETWKENGMGSWNLNKLPDPGDDGIIDVLMVGNSWCYYYVEELYQLAKAAGIEMRVCNAYYSGCPIDKHYTWWVNGESNYQYFETYANGRKMKSVAASLEWCLAQREWDVITMNLGGTEMRTLATAAVISYNLPFAKSLFDYFAESFPNADLYMHQTWAYELGYVKDYASGDFEINTVADQQAYTQKTRDVVSAICEENGVGRINTGDAWELYRAACEEAGIENNLCARLGNNNNQGDKSHDGDIGGGQYLNACVWFEILTGQDCRGTTYIPNYSEEYPISETMAKMLQEAAHKAVTEILPTYSNNQ